MPPRPKTADCGHNVVMDSAPTRTNQEYRTLAKLEFPWVHHACVGAGMTSVAQPLDRSYMRTYRSTLHVAKHFAEWIESGCAKHT
eukprot:2129134-Amphidinium_carterae.1